MAGKNTTTTTKIYSPWCLEPSGSGIKRDKNKTSDIFEYAIWKSNCPIYFLIIFYIWIDLEALEVQKWKEKGELNNLFFYYPLIS